jgi:rare lipoprotein A
MRYHASLTAAFLLLAGCVGNGGYTDLPEVAAPSANARGLAQEDPYARPDDAFGQPDTGYDQPRKSRRERQPRLEVAQADPYSGVPGASYDPAASNSPAQGYTPPAQDYSPPAQSYVPPPQQGDPTAGMQGPRGTSNDEQRYDEVGYAGVRGVSGGDPNGGAVVAIAKSVPAGTFLEVTNLDTGRTIIVLVTGQLDAGADHPVDLSPGAVSQLGASGSTIPVRVRKVVASGADQTALRQGRPAAERPETPPVLLTALRKHLPSQSVASYSPPPRQASAGVSRQPARPTPAAGRGGYYVQVGAFSNAANAQSLAQTLGGFVRPSGGLHRVQMGPYRSNGEAEAARANAARRGYGDARVFTQ